MKSKKIILIAIIIVLLLILIAGGAFVYFKTDLFKSNDELFYKYAFNLEQMKINNKNNKKITDSNSLKLTGDASINLQTNSANMTAVETLLNGLKLNYEYAQNLNTKQQQASASLNFKDKELANIKYLRDADTYGITIKDILTTYLSVENNNLKSLFSKLGVTDVSNIPDKIEFKDYDTKNLIDEETKNYIIEKYKDVIKQNISVDKFSKEQQNITIDGVEVKANKYNLTLSVQDMKNIVLEVLKALKDDDRTLNLVVEKTGLIASSMQASSGDTETLKNDLKDSIQESIDSITEETIENNDTIKISVYEKNGKTVKHEILLNDITIVSIEYTDNKINFIFNYNGTQLNMTITTQSDSNSNTTTIDGNMTIDDESIPFKFTETESDNNNVITDNVTIEFGIDESNTVKIVLNNNIELSENLEIEKLTNDNSVKINDMSAEEIASVMNTLSSRVSSMFENKINELTGEIANSGSSSTGSTNLGSSSTGNSIDNAMTQMNQQETEAFNSVFSAFEGQNVSASIVKTLITKVITNNQSTSNVVSINGISDITQLQSYITSIDTTKKYTVVMNKGSNGKINNITIQ